MKKRNYAPILSESNIPQIELSYSIQAKVSTLPCVTNTKIAYDYLLRSWDTNKIQFVEQFKVMVLNRANRMLGICTLANGATVGVLADTRLIFAVALLTNASYIILAHNHPSGSFNPSVNDIKMTEEICNASKLLGITILDHFIITKEGYYSFADEGRMVGTY